MLSKLQISTLAVGTIFANNSPKFSYHGYEGPNVNEDCSNFNGNVGCTDGQQVRYPDEWSKRSF